MCSDADQCSRLTQEDHLESYSHPNIRDIRLVCDHPGYQCRSKSDIQHCRKYRHGKNHDHLSIAPSRGFNVSINFVRNQSQMIKTVNEYVEASHWQTAKLSTDILKWLRALQPVHRCAKDIFESILIHGHVMSRDYMSELTKPEKVALAVRQHSRVRLIFLKNNSKFLKKTAYQLIDRSVEIEFEKSRPKPTSTDAKTSTHPDREQEMDLLVKKLKPSLDDNDITAIREWASKIAQASIKLNDSPTGIGYGVDQILGTDKHVFSILGPHRGHYYGDIIIIFKKELMLHPDTNFSIQAGTSFGPSKSAYVHRPWLKDPGSAEKSAQNFHHSKLHCSVPSYEYAAATELIALTGLKQQSMRMSLQDVLKRWMEVDSHQVFESHLPQLIPLDYIDSVYIPKNIFDLLSLGAQKSAKAVFKGSLFITEHQIDLTVSAIPGKGMPLDSTRESFQNYVLGQICEKIQKKMDQPNVLQGIVVTIAASEFNDHIIVPMSILQAYSLYCHQKHQTERSLEYTYIYWQAMKGDMLLTISSEQITSAVDSSDLQCLMCYIAKTPSTKSEDYHEAYSCLNNGSPNQHTLCVEDSRFKAKSNRFYMGCNTEDYFTLCLKISHKTGLVTLSHAGSNSIYNHEKIEYRFNKADVDLTKLDFIHLSAGSEDVPIRNLTINFEPIAELHPKVDMTFQIDTSALRKQNLNPYYIDNPPVTAHRPLAPRQKKPGVPISSEIFEKKESFFTRLFGTFTCRQTLVNDTIISKPPALTSSKLPPCQDSVYCLHQNLPDHIAKYSHPCRFSELCRNQASEPHLVHLRHDVPRCTDDENCTQKHDPIHRAKYRHKNLPDYLFPCRNQAQCRDTTTEHRIKHSHGEKLPGIDRK